MEYCCVSTVHVALSQLGTPVADAPLLQNENVGELLRQGRIGRIGRNR